MNQHKAQDMHVSHAPTGKVLNLVEADASDWEDSWPTHLADSIPVSEGVGTINGANFCFWIGGGDPATPQIQRTIELFLSDHDVVAVCFVRAVPTKVHPSIAEQFAAVEHAKVAKVPRFMETFVPWGMNRSPLGGS